MSLFSLLSPNYCKKKKKSQENSKTDLTIAFFSSVFLYLLFIKREGIICLEFSSSPFFPYTYNEKEVTGMSAVQEDIRNV